MDIPVSKTAKSYAEGVSITVEQPFQTDQPVTFVIKSPICPRPYYVIRLAGPALVVSRQQHHFELSGAKFPPSIMSYREGVGQLQFAYNRKVAQPIASNVSTVENNSQGTLTKIQMYPIPRSGKYSLEILQLSCNSTFEAATTTCLPNTYDTMTLNQFPTHLDLEHQQSLLNQLSVGYWGYDTEVVNAAVNGTDISNGDNAPNPTPTESYPLIRTRYQSAMTSTCPSCQMAWRSKYKWIDHEVFDYPKTHKDIKRHLCFVGASHALWMNKMFLQLFASHGITSTHSSTNSVRLRFLQRFNPARAQQLKQEGCTDIIFAAGQWPLSHENPRKTPDHPDMWAGLMAHAINIMEQHAPNIRVIFRNIHQNSLKFNVMKCRPIDFRVPYFVEAYNERLRELFDKNPILTKPNSRYQFMDTNAAVLPVWDTWNDWNHLSPNVFLLEAEYMLRRMTLVPPGNQTIPTPPPAEKEANVREISNSSNLGNSTTLVVSNPENATTYTDSGMFPTMLQSAYQQEHIQTILTLALIIVPLIRIVNRRISKNKIPVRRKKKKRGGKHADKINEELGS